MDLEMLANKTKDPVQNLTLYQIRKELAGKDDQLLPDRETLNREDLYLGSPPKLTPARLYFEGPRKKRPKWFRFFEDHLPQGVENCWNLNWPAILLLEVEGVTFAVPFSGGHHLLEIGTWSRSFGLRAALNLIALEKVRSFDKKNFGGLHKQAREQAGKEARLDDFGIDPTQDLLRSMTGKSNIPNLASSVTGAATLRFSARVTPENLPRRIRRFYRLSQRRDYEEQYPWIGTIAEIHHPDEIGIFDLEMTGSFWEEDRCSLAPPDIIDWSEFEGYRFVIGRHNPLISRDIDLRHLKNLWKSQSVEPTDLKRVRVELLDADHKVLKKWKLYDCVNFELEMDQRYFVLSSGSWYEVDRDLVGAVATEVSKIPNVDLRLPAFRDETEARYVQRAADESSGWLANLDRKTIWYGGGRSQIEFCDLASSDGHLIYVKQYGGAEQLSHLFNQASTVAELLKGDEGFRREAEAHITKFAPKFDTSILVSRHCKIVISIIFPPGRSGHPLPLFSRINLRSAMTRHKIAGYPMFLCPIVHDNSHWLLKRKMQRRRQRK